MRKIFKYHKFWLVNISLLFLFHLSIPVFAQTYGLKFNGFNFTLDKRTELDLTPYELLKVRDDFEISFDYKTTRIIPNSTVGFFGYVFRIINEEDDNIDLISTPTPQVGLNIVVGKTNTIIPVEYPLSAIDNWIKIRIKFLLHENRLLVYTPDTFYVKENLGFKQQEAFKIIFGANDYKQFKNTDVPSMTVKDIEIFEKGKRKYHWQLNEKEGFLALDRINGKKARVINPSWVALNYQNWQKNIEHEFIGAVTETADPVSGNIFMVGEEGLAIYSAQKNTIQKILYKNNSPFLSNQHRVIFNSIEKKIYCYLADEGPCYSLSTETGEWTEIISSGEAKPYFRHHNSSFHAPGNNIYIFGGYGLHKYNNTIVKIDLSARKWVDLPTDDSIFYPRYLAGLGTLNDTFYILGGYGSRTGNQLINPQSYFDLLGYSIDDSSLFKKFEIPQILDDMIVGNSMWIDGKTRNYYALVFSKLTFDGSLQLIRGNLDSPDVKMVGNKMPFKFLDIRSFADLYYMPDQNKLYAYLSYSEDTTTSVAIYSIDYPPNNSIEELLFTENKSLIVYFSVAILLILSAWFLVRTRLRIRKMPEFKGLVRDGQSVLSSGGNDYQKAENAAYQIIFFGGFQVINRNNEDITNEFSPLLKELFLLIVLYSFRNDKGISSEKITEVLWYDKSEKSARNNRAVNIAKLRSIIKEVGKCDLSKKTGYWKFILEDSDIRSDYVDFINIASSKSSLTKQKVKQLIQITRKGAFLSDLNYDWLDDFKASVSDKLIDTLLKFGQSVDVKEEADFIIHLADSVLNFDIVNEEAMILKCQAEHYLGKHSLAKNTYELFFKKYMEMYGEEYNRTFHEILKQKV